MKTKEREKAKPGSYQAVFDGFIRKGGALGLSVSKKPGSPKRVLFRVKSEDGVQIPCSFPWVSSHPAAESTLGAIGVPLAAILKYMANEKKAPAVLAAIEKKALQKKYDLSVWVRPEGTGWGSAIKPYEGTFVVEFAGVQTRDPDSKKPIHTRKTGKRQSKQGGTYDFDEDTFRVSLRVLSGPRKGASLGHRLEYAIKQDDDGEWYVDAESGRGAEFKSFLTAHRIATSKLDPDRDFKDPKNGLPEIEKLLLARKTPLQAVVEKGWVNSLGRLPEGTAEVSTASAEDFDQPEYKANNISELFEAIDSVSRKKFGKTAWHENGELTAAGKRVKQSLLDPLMEKISVPTEFEELSQIQVKSVLKALQKVRSKKAQN